MYNINVLKEGIVMKWLIVLFMSLLAGCSMNYEPEDIIQANQGSMIYGVSDYMYFMNDVKVLDMVVEDYDSLVLSLTEQEIDFMNAIQLDLKNKEDKINRIWLDQHGIYHINNQNYTKVKGTLTFDKLKKLYDESKK